MEDSYKDVLQGISSSCCHDMMECFGARERHYNAGDVICEYNQHSTLVGILKKRQRFPDPALTFTACAPSWRPWKAAKCSAKPWPFPA